jgi:hypothetical protein
MDEIIEMYSQLCALGDIWAGAATQEPVSTRRPVLYFDVGAMVARVKKPQA